MTTYTFPPVVPPALNPASLIAVFVVVEYGDQTEPPFFIQFLAFAKFANLYSIGIKPVPVIVPKSFLQVVILYQGQIV